jgi:hypothetical protein
MKETEGNNKTYSESKLEVSTYIDRLKYALLSNQAKILFQEQRRVDVGRNEKYTNRFTIANLFPDEDPVAALKRELGSIMIEEYIETVKDLRCPNRTDMRVFGKIYNNEGVYIKIRVELLKSTPGGVDDFIFVMSFHYSTIGFDKVIFPYSKN